MKYGFHTYLFTESWSDRSLDILNYGRDLGADVVEIGVGDDVFFDAAKTRKRAESLGLELMISPGGLWPAHCDISDDDPSHRASGLEWLKRYANLAAELGATTFSGALYGHPGHVEKRMPPDDEYSRTAEGLHDIAEYAATKGVRIALEPMSHFRTHIANKPLQLARLIRMANHPNLSILIDTYHMITEVRDYGEAIRNTNGLMMGMHACENDRGVPGGGLVPWDDIFQTLAEIGFDGYIGLESYNSAQGDFAWRRGMFHDVCPSAQDFIEKGFAFLRKMEKQFFPRS
ncbi:MAG: sugar phosphate isomerase/epimerase family protein [Candidatus Sumerlaeia bacterium]